jgi:hypothetical protein
MALDVERAILDALMRAASRHGVSKLLAA